jgi:hypothetical protein
MEHQTKTLWNEYFAEGCAAIDTEEERELVKKASKMHEAANELLTEEQRRAVEKYIDALFEIQNSFVKKAFFRGCRFAMSFLIETGFSVSP